MKILDDVASFGFRQGVLGTGNGVDGSENYTGKPAELDDVLGEDYAGDAAVGRLGRDRGELQSGHPGTPAKSIQRAKIKCRMR